MRILASLLVASSFLLISQASFSADNPETVLYEKMRDISAIAHAGVSYQDYSKLMMELVVDYDHFLRWPGRKDGDRAVQLYLAEMFFVKGRDTWSQLIQEGSYTDSDQDRAIRENEITENLQYLWGHADSSLDKYDKLNSPTQDSQPNATSPQ